MKAISDVKLNYLIGKIKSWFAETRTWATETFCPKAHTHDVETDVTGILAPEHGGTGVESIDALVSLLKIQPEQGGQSFVNFVYKSYEGEGRFGKTNPVTMPLDFCPKLMFIHNTSANIINAIPFAYYPADEENQERSSFSNVQVCSHDTYVRGGISGSYKDGVLSWYFANPFYTAIRADLENGHLVEEQAALASNDDIGRSMFQQDEEGTIYRCYIFG